MKKETNDKYVINSINVFRLIVCSIVVCIALGLLLYAFYNYLPDVIEKLEEEGKMEKTIEILKYNSHVPPVIVVAIIIWAFYHDKKKCIPVMAQKEKLIIASVAAGFTYFVMLPYVIIMSGGAEAFNGGAVENMLNDTITWFGTQIIPFIILITYHAVRIGAEKKELEQNDSQKP